MHRLLAAALTCVAAALLAVGAGVGIVAMLSATPEQPNVPVVHFPEHEPRMPSEPPPSPSPSGPAEPSDEPSGPGSEESAPEESGEGGEGASEAPTAAATEEP